MYYRTHGRWRPRALLQLFLLEILASICVTGTATEQRHCKTAGVATAARATEAVPRREGLLLQQATKASCLLQAAIHQSRLHNSAEEEQEDEPDVAKFREEDEERTVEEMGEKEDFLQARQEPVPGRLLFGTALLKPNHTANISSDYKTSTSLQPVSQLQVSSHSYVLDSNHATASVPFSTNEIHQSRLHNKTEKEQEEEEEPVVAKQLKGPVEETGGKESSLQAGQEPVPGRLLFGTGLSNLNHTANTSSDNKTSTGMQAVSHLQVSSHSLVFDSIRAIAFVPFTTSESRLNMWIVVSWLLPAALFFVTVLVCICLGAECIASSARTVNDTIRPRAKVPPGKLRQLRENPEGGLSQRTNLTLRSPTSIKASSVSWPISPPELASTLVLGQPDSISSGSTAFLSPDLVVPPGCESILRIPINPPNSFHVIDTEGNNVLRVELQVGRKIPRERRCVVLATSDGFVLAQCLATAAAHSSAIEFHLRHPSGEYYAKLVQGAPGEPTKHHESAWTVQSHAGAEWFFFASSDSSYDIEVTDKTGKMLATSQVTEETEDQHGDVRKSLLVRVGPLMDVSVVLLSLLAIRHLM
mmetsp:Transcript_6929/g.13401  ORF Transcript_6929/g.13401 Transcript_6929/m.13401 type:complete len:586 (-) Transcript_6929:85-1842(-)